MEQIISSKERDKVDSGTQAGIQVPVTVLLSMVNSSTFYYALFTLIFRRIKKRTQHAVYTIYSSKSDPI